MDISKKKPNYPINDKLRAFLKMYGREQELPVTYDDLLRSESGFPVLNNEGEDTLWETMMYDQSMLAELNEGLTTIYALLKTDGDVSVMEHLYVDRIDYCHFGNSKPFRIRIMNQFNDNYDYFYVKVADASRVYGLELEHTLSPNRISYLVDGNSLIEEHIAGIPGDNFIDTYFSTPNFNKVRLAKEFVKFNERCFVRLLGDMRSYNYVIDITPDFDAEQYRVRAIDFDQQCFEGKAKMYLPQFFKENNPIIKFCIEVMNPETVLQYQYEERILIMRRYQAAHIRMNDLLDCMCNDTLSTPDKVNQLRHELNAHHHTIKFDKSKNMGEILKLHLELMLTKPRPAKIIGKFNFKAK